MQRLTVLRLALGILFLWSGVDKALNGFSATEYLLHATGPVAQFFQAMAGNPIVDFLVVFGEIGIGLSLLSGLLLTFACYCGMVMMVLFYFSKFPPEHGLVSEQLIYFLIFWLLAEKERFFHMPFRKTVKRN